jgi:hypothetical protein
MMPMRTFLVTALVLCGACSIYGGDDVEAEADGGAEVDAAEPVACVVTADRGTSCRFTVCVDSAELCPGVSWTVCFEECVAGVADVGWCPGQSVGQ